MIGTTLLHYAIDARLGEGGMGTVYRARDTVLNRTVAIKVLTAAADAESTSRLLREARAASALNHPNSVTIHAVEQHGGVNFLVMEYVAGVPLDRAIPATGFPLDRALAYASGIAAAVAAAHAQGIVHRDLKPANVMVTPDDRVKVLDFGIARRTALAADALTQLSTVEGTLAGTGVLIGTAGYMSPEQVQAQPADERSDVFALGVIIYELLTGTAPFRRETTWGSLEATVYYTPAPVDVAHRGMPPALTAIVSRCLAKDPAQRPASAGELHRELEAVRQSLVDAGPRRRWNRGAVIAGVIAIVAIAVGAFALSRVREGRLRWVRDTAIPEIHRLLAAGDPMAAYRLALEARQTLPDDPQMKAVWDGVTQTVQLATDPPGAAVSFRALSGKDEGWIALGTSPVTADVPFGQLRWRFELAGHDPLEIVPNPFPSEVVLVRSGSAPDGMVRVRAGTFEKERDLTQLALPAFWIDTTEVTNRQFKAFVDAGGYGNRSYWREPFLTPGRSLTWEEAMARFRDTTGRPGPATWELGAFADDQADLPVAGVSWYEAAAYAAWAGKSLPTIYHWSRASGAFGIFSDILQYSNFNGRGLVRVGTSASLGPFGTHDLAGNVKEWIWNEGGTGQRFILGGAWSEPPYKFHDEDASDPFERLPEFGFRCIKPDEPLAANLTAAVTTLARDPSRLKPVSDEVFQAHRALYDYDRGPLDARVDERDDAHPHYVVERVSFNAAYGNERVPMMLFLPRAARPPYQVLVYFPSSDAVRSQSSRTAYLQLLDFLPRSGRAVAFPVYQQTFERRRQVRGPNFTREISIQRGLDVRRTVDYLESRPDIDKAKVGLYGLSLGAQLAPVYLGIEPRLRLGILLAGGFETWTIPAESDPVNFAPRVTQPVLMINGRDDFDLPYDTAQLPLFNALGTRPEDKRHIVLDGGHVVRRPQEVFKVILDWLDKYLGPVGQ